MEFARITKLGSLNYEPWSFSVKALLRRERLWKFVEPGVAPNPLTEVWTAGDEKALTTIQLLVEDRQHRFIQGKETAKAAWDALKEHHSKLTLEQKVSTIIQIANQTFRDGDSMDTYIGEFEQLYGRLDNAGMKIQECVKVALILRGLPATFRPLIMALGARDEDDLTLDLVKDKLIDEAANYKSICEAEEKALKVRTGRRKVLICYHCGKPGHRKADCEEYSTEDDEDDKSKKHKEKALKAIENSCEEITLAVTSGKIGSKSWLIDSGASSHLTSDRSAFVKIDESVRSVVTTAGGNKLRTAGVGDCVIKSVDARGRKVNITLTDVLFVPRLEGSLISVGKLSEKGVLTTFNGGKCELLRGDKVIATAARIDGLYQLMRARCSAIAVRKRRLQYRNWRPKQKFFDNRDKPDGTRFTKNRLNGIDLPVEEVIVRLEEDIEEVLQDEAFYLNGSVVQEELCGED